MSGKIDRFAHKYQFLSNFFMVNVEMDGDIYRSVEHAYQAAKTMDPHKRARIRAAYSAGAAKSMGRHVVLRPDWELVKVDIMRALLIDKFTYPYLASMLLETEDSELVEGNTWGDSFWGVYEPPLGAPFGQNMLGKLLMETRDQLRKSQEVTG